MSRYRFLLSRRWLTIAVVAVVVAAACVMLGRWQWERHVTRAAANDLVTTNYDTPAVALDALLDPTGAVPADLVWRPVELTGQFVGEQVTLRNRPVVGTDSVRVLAVVRAATGGEEVLVVVDRGWLPGQVTPPPTPDGEVVLTARLRQSEPPDGRTAPDGQVFRIDPATVLAATGVGADLPLLDGYLLAAGPALPADGAAADPAADAPLQPFPRPETTPGSHLSYAFQWWVFALGALVGLVILAHREAAETTGPPRRPDRPERPDRRRSDADEEDALIQAQLGPG